MIINQLFILLILGILTIEGFSQDKESYYFNPIKEFKKNRGLPDPFLKPDGSRVTSHTEWEKQRKYIIAMLEHYQYGEMPPTPEDVKVKETLSEEIFNGYATRKLYTLILNRNGKDVELRFGLIKPKGNGPFPLIIKNDRDVPDPMNHDKEKLKFGNMQIPEEALREALDRGYIYCAYNREDLSIDLNNRDENRKTGIFPLYPEYNWGTIAAWAWGYKLLIDYFEKIDFIDIEKIVVTGHSRGGKTAVCGGIFDERIAITAPNSSGLGGTASHRYFQMGEIEQTLGHATIWQTHWWSLEYYKLNGYENMIPFDAHFNKIAIAPRAFFNTHALQDYFANPFGTYLTHEAAKEVYKWLGAENNIALHLRTGAHAQNVIDWFALLDFADNYFYNKSVRSISRFGDYDFFKTNPYPNVRIPVYWDTPENNK